MLKDAYVNPTALNTRIIKPGTSLEWHRRLGHICHADMIRLAKSGVEKTLSLDIVKETFDCEACHQGKMARTPFQDSTSPSTTAPLQLVHTDICGPMKSQSFGHARWFVIFLDDYSNYFQLYPLTRPGQMAESFKKFHQHIMKHLPQYPLLKLRSDNGPEYHNTEFEGYLAEHGIKHEFTVRHTPQQNGKAERLMRTIQEGIKTVLIDAELPMVFWALAASFITHVRNRVIPSMKNSTPYELFYDDKPSLTSMRPFGCKVFIYQPKETRGKLEPAAHPGLFVGYEEGVKGFKVYDTKRRRIYMSRDLLFYENDNLTLPEEILVPDDGYTPTKPWIDFSLLKNQGNATTTTEKKNEKDKSQAVEDNAEQEQVNPVVTQRTENRPINSNISPMRQLIVQELQQRISRPNLGLNPVITENNIGTAERTENNVIELELRRSKRTRKPNQIYNDCEVDAPPSVYEKQTAESQEMIESANIVVSTNPKNENKNKNKKATDEPEQQLIGLKNSSHYLLTNEQIDIPDRVALLKPVYINWSAKITVSFKPTLL